MERDLAERLGTSLTAIREALIQLETEGLITKKPNATTHVVQLSASDIRQVFEVRMVLEAYAFEQAARNAAPEDLKKIDNLHAKAIQAAKTADACGYIAQDLLLHEAVWAATRNTFLLETLRRVSLPLFGFSAISVASQKGFDLKRDAQSHTPLLQAIKSGSAPQARMAFEKAAKQWLQQSLETAGNGRSK